MRKYIIPIFLILLCSCVEDLRIKGEFIPELIVNGFLCPDSCITVHISKTRPIKSSGTPNLYDLRRLDIQVSINEGDFFPLELDSSSLSSSEQPTIKFLCQTKPKPGDKIEITANDPKKEYKSIYAHTHIPEPIEINYVTHFTEYHDFPTGSHNYEMDSLIHFVFSIKDNPNVKNYYKILFTNFLYFDYTDYGVSFDRIDGPVNYYDPIFSKGNIKLIDDTIIPYNPYEVKLSIWDEIYGSFFGTIYHQNPSHRYFFFSVECLTKEGYLYLKSREAALNSEQDIFTEPIALYSNIHGGKGIFYGFSAPNILLEFIDHMTEKQMNIRKNVIFKSIQLL